MCNTVCGLQDLLLVTEVNVIGGQSVYVDGRQAVASPAHPSVLQGVYFKRHQRIMQQYLFSSSIEHKFIKNPVGWREHV